MLNAKVFHPAERVRTGAVPQRRWAVAHARFTAEDGECAVATGGQHEPRDSGPRPYIAVVLMESPGKGDGGSLGESGGSPGERGGDPLYEESVLLVYATDEADARRRAERRARSRETSYLNDRGETVSWCFKCVVDVSAALDEDLTQDADLYARHFRDYAAYERFEPLLSGEEL
ncbi:hypothetical protein GKJPGBOP_05420 [Streptomyces paromomycinus]|uniref:DUF4288 domain-containing protein n=1 Tax=Streptomyces paromomycinus TaxID=92743 RepID=A0A401W8P3_STREY|nr:hypothetical protein GKJPGBOP_05420 [Streptomyces paromomycinus]